MLHYSTYAAGLLLARQGRPEAVNCISGLRQYAFAYEEAHIQADELEATLAAVNRERTQREQQDDRHDASSSYAGGRVGGQVPPFAVGLPAVTTVHHHHGHGSVVYGGNEVRCVMMCVEFGLIGDQVPNQYGMYEPMASMSAANQPSSHDGFHYNNSASRR